MGAQIQIMSQQNERFFTAVGCMDGRVQEVVAEFGRIRFGAEYPDTITEAGLVGKLVQENADQGLIDSIKNKLVISLQKHHSKGIIVHGHQECAASDAVEDEKHKDDIRKSVELIKSLVNASIPVVGVFVKRSKKDPNIWEAEEISSTVLV